RRKEHRSKEDFTGCRQHPVYKIPVIFTKKELFNLKTNRYLHSVQSKPVTLPAKTDRVTPAAHSNKKHIILIVFYSTHLS
ncbi:MAG: hypothetical protein LUE93_04055, partial [Bacteroides sp.]|nr:hypothetical protein [Bacteroides sp.]